MNKKYLIAALLAAGVLGAAGYGLYTLGMKNGSSMAGASIPATAGSQSAVPAADPQSVAQGEEATRRHIGAGLKAGDTDPVTGRKILYYHDPMVPGSKFDKPAKSPFMDMMLVPTEALIKTGKRTVVLLAQENGRFQPVDIEAGIESGGQTEIRRGLQAGQRVVVSSQFLIDSEASLKGVEARLNEAPTPPAATAAPRHEGQARVEAIGKDGITLSHGPIQILFGYGKLQARCRWLGLSCGGSMHRGVQSIGTRMGNFRS